MDSQFLGLQWESILYVIQEMQSVGLSRQPEHEEFKQLFDRYWDAPVCDHLKGGSYCPKCGSKIEYD